MCLSVNGVLAGDVNFDEIEDLCNAALFHGDDFLTFDDIKSGILAREMQLWLVKEEETIKAACVTRINIFRKFKALTCIVLSGEEMPTWIEMADSVLTRFAKENGCTVFKAHGRTGWGKMAKKMGWDKTIITYVKEVR